MVPLPRRKREQCVCKLPLADKFSKGFKTCSSLPNCLWYSCKVSICLITGLINLLLVRRVQFPINLLLLDDVPQVVSVVPERVLGIQLVLILLIFSSLPLCLQHNLSISSFLSLPLSLVVLLFTKETANLSVFFVQKRCN
ncbi:hypothetical protein D8674_024469 [Pyrus ussuriensis x Pyrus communis]|uniref:Uncharacterized protein n=1 Tax=Pyrus ussuriensis x Pyrus communis TaxID=2448454 RepID=A0A5N5H586_9ROSA|nr:hypothetical protein D8674_024469 [Pyrus ussuriensis x Pyrus communis]